MELAQLSQTQALQSPGLVAVQTMVTLLQFVERQERLLQSTALAVPPQPPMFPLPQLSPEPCVELEME